MLMWFLKSNQPFFSSFSGLELRYIWSQFLEPVVENHGASCVKGVYLELNQLRSRLVSMAQVSMEI